jgi:hypothetical protein
MHRILAYPITVVCDHILWETGGILKAEGLGDGVDEGMVPFASLAIPKLRLRLPPDLDAQNSVLPTQNVGACTATAQAPN